MLHVSLPEAGGNSESSSTGGCPDVVVVGGGGHVGLPLSLLLVQTGLRVGIYDTSQATVDRICRGEMPFLENGADVLLPEMLATGRLSLSTSRGLLRDVEQVVVVVGTPIDEFMNPSMTLFDRAVDELEPHLAPDAL